MSIHSMIVYPGQQPSQEVLEEIRAAAKKSITFDEDCPELTDEQLQKFAVLAKQQREARKKPILSMRVSSETLDKAKKLGKDYTDVLGRLLDLAINDPEMVKRCL